MEATGGPGPSACRYDVFLSFRGPDTRKIFTDFLHRTMVDQGIVTYIDSEDLEVGNRIDDLLTVIGNSKICIPIFSRGYASSAWCLRELARMMDLYESTGKPAILPIFFDVTPLDVKLRTKVYEEDLKKHERRKLPETEGWKAALTKVPETKGWEVQDKKYIDVIELVVKEVLHRLKVKQRHLNEKLIGVDEQVESIMELLHVDSGTTVLLVGIHGMGGIGKTTLAKIVFNKLCSRFDGRCSFIENVRESSSKGNGLVDLQKKLVSDISDSRFEGNFSTTDGGIDSIRRIASSKKVLLVLDDLDNKEQLKKLVGVGGPATFGSGSRIIITTRDKGIVREKDGILPYEVEQMDSDKALKLFSLHAFDSASPPDTYQSLSQEVVLTTGGLPLALEVIGASLRGKDQKIWKAMFEKLKRVPHKDVQATLKISYDGLGSMEKDIFLDIACFFKGKNKSRSTYFWDACGLYPVVFLEELTNLCLIKIVDDVIWMHDQLIDLGRVIVREERTTGCSRLWDCEEALGIVKSKARKDKLQALHLYEYYDSNPISIADEELERMPYLKFLHLRGVTFVGDVNNYLQELRWFSWDFPPLIGRMAKLHFENLVVFELSYNENTEDWGGWNILKMENKLKVLSLMWCSGLTRTPDFSGCLSLEELSIEECPNLQEVGPSIGKLEGLTRLNIRSCSLQNLPKEIGGLVKLEYFHITDCWALEKLSLSIFKFASLSELCLNKTRITHLPDSIGDAKHLSLLDVSQTSIVELPLSIGELMQLEFLKLSSCWNLRELPESIGNLTSLQNLDISETKIDELPDSIQNLKQLKVLKMGKTRIRRLPSSIEMLGRLEEFDAQFCKQLAVELPTEIGGLSSLRILDISSTRVCAVPTAIISFTRLQKLDLMYCDELEELPKFPPNLTHLRVQSKSLRSVADLSNLTNLVELILSTGFEPPCAQASRPMQTLQLQGIGKLSKLEKLTSNFHVPPTELGRLTRLTELTFSNVDSFDSVAVGPQFSNCKYLSKLSLIGSRRREMQLAGLDLLRELYVYGFDLLEELSFMPSSLRNIRTIVVEECPMLLEIRFLGAMMESLKEIEIEQCESLAVLRGLSNAEALQKLRIYWCKQLEIVEGLEGLYVSECGSLVGLTDVSSNNSIIPKECWIEVKCCAKLSNYEGTCEDYRERSKKLKVLKIVCTPIVELPISIGELMQLEFLKITSCKNLRKLPESIGNLTSLRELNIINTIIVELPDSIQNLKQLKVLKIRWTPIVELPISIGELMQLEFLGLSDCESLRKLPESIGNLTSLQNLDISNTIIVELPDSIQNLKQLNVLKMGKSRICAVPTTIISLTRLQELNLMDCNELQELPKLPSCLTCLHVQARSLRLVSAISYLTNLEKLILSTGSGPTRARASSQMQTLQLQWVGKLSKLNTPSLDALVPPLELGYLTRLTDPTLSGMDCFDSVIVGPQFSNLKYLSSLTLCYSPLREMQLDGLEQLRYLTVRGFDLLEGLSFMPSCLKSMLAISICECPRLLEIRFHGAMMESLDSLEIDNLNSLAVLRGLSNAEKLGWLRISRCNELQVVEVLEGLCISECGPLEGLTHVSSNSMIPKKCWISVERCAKLSEYDGTYGKYYREMIKKKDKMEKDLEGSIEENDIIVWSDSEDSMEEEDSNGCSDLEDSTKDNDNIDCFIGVVECICKPFTFFRREKSPEAHD